MDEEPPSVAVDESRGPRITGAFVAGCDDGLSTSGVEPLVEDASALGGEQVRADLFADLGDGHGARRSDGDDSRDVPAEL